MSQRKDDDQFRTMALRSVGEDGIASALALRDHVYACFWCRHVYGCRKLRDLQLAYHQAVLAFLGESSRLLGWDKDDQVSG